jgi:hypothetical protein
MNFIRSLGYFYAQPIWTVLVIFQVVLLTKRIWKKDLEILKYHYSYGICKGTDLIVFEKNHKDAKETLKGNSKIYSTKKKTVLWLNKAVLNIKWFG